MKGRGEGREKRKERGRRGEIKEEEGKGKERRGRSDTPLKGLLPTPSSAAFVSGHSCRQSKH